MKAGHVVYVHLNKHFISEPGNELWSTEAWYTMNRIPQNTLGALVQAPAVTSLPDNTLSEAEKQAGWKLLFNGQNYDGWRNFRKDKVTGTDWNIADQAIHLSIPSGERSGGDIVTADSYENFELTLDWKLSACGNSGIFYFVQESDQYDYVWQTGPECQVLDNNCHPDSKFVTHRAGDLYDLIACKYENTKPPGQWNQVRIVHKNGKVEHWLNNRKLVSYDFDSKAFRDLIAKSKFKDMPGFARIRKGHIALQDHSDEVWYKNIKIREL
jgi:cytochrome c